MSGIHATSIFRRAALLIALALALAPGLARGASGDDAPTEAGVKAAFLVNFMKYAKWPDARFTSAEAPLVIVVLGTDPLGKELEKAVSGRRLHDRPIEVRRIRAWNDEEGTLAAARSAHLLFVAASEERHERRIVAALRDADVFTVGDRPGFCRAGGMLGFVPNEGRVGFEANPGAIRLTGVKVSSKLLGLATIVQTAAGG